MTNQDQHVYCVNCKEWKELIKAIMSDWEVPKNCEGCYPYNPEDSFPFSIRKNYIEKQDL